VPRLATPIAQSTSKNGSWWEYVDHRGEAKIVVQHPDGSIHRGTIKACSRHREGGPPRNSNPGNETLLVASQPRTRREACATPVASRASRGQAVLREDIGLSPDRFSISGYEESKDYWERYVARVRAQNDLYLQWSEADVADVHDWVDAVRSRSQGRRVLWFAPMAAGVPPVADVPAEKLLEHGVELFAMKSRDFMVASSDLSDGLCLELVPVGRTYKFEVASWGEFAETEV
jgi:hypothetical protein